MKSNSKIKNLVDKVERGLLEREELTRLTFLALFSQESVFMLGEPGVAKSLLARRMKEVVKDATNFEYLMNRFSTPEEIFGPIKLSMLNEDKFERETEGYLPTADIAFLDEIWKASPAIQNTLLTIINEKIYRNGSEDVKVPLKLLLAASNELPEQGAGLEALYDRFMIRYYVDPIADESNFNKLVRQTKDEFEIKESDKIGIEELEDVYKKSLEVEIEDGILEFIHTFRKTLVVELGDKAPYISDRRWKKIFKMLRVNAVISERKSVELADLGLVTNFIWETAKQKGKLQSIFDRLFVDAVAKTAGTSSISISKEINEAEKLLSEGYIYIDEQVSAKAPNPEDGKGKLTYYKYSFNGQTYVWIPMDEKGVIAATDARYFYIYYSSKDTKIISTSTHEVEGWKMDRINLKAGNYDGTKLGEIRDKSKKIDKAKLNKAKELVDNLSHKIAILERDIDNSVKDLLSVETTLNISYTEDVELARASIKDSMRKIISRKNEVLGKIVNALGK